MSDLISREKAIEALGEKPVGDTDWDLGCRNQWEWDTEILRTLPSAEPERKEGEWIDGKPYVNSHWRVCSICYETSPDSSGYYNFCPNCGAEMTRGDR